MDLDTDAVWLCQVILAAECLPVLARVPETRRQLLPALARVGDGLAAPASPAFAVVMNPPYGRVKLEEAERTRFEHVLTGHANLYGLFMGHHIDQLAPGGVLAALVPTSFTSGAYFTNLRNHLTATAPLREIAFVSDRAGVFADVLQETCLATFTRNPCKTVRVGFINGHLAEVAKVPPVAACMPWVLPRRREDASLAAKASGLPLTLATAGWGVSTGPLVWNRRKGDLHSRPGKDRVPIVWGADLRDGILTRDPTRADKRYLSLHGDRDTNTMVLDEPAILVQRTTAPEQARRLVATELTETLLTAWGGRVVAENHVNVLRPTATTPLVPRELLARLLATDELDRVLRCVSGSVAVSAFELEALPLPSRRVLAAWEHLDSDALGQAVAKCYGMTTK